ncbi:MAG: hypothetical protein JO182_03475 [Acidobacteriaceae bacterium]|nr:hypothetical protein [Acidobacteriaceae bacterium]
MKAGLPSDDFTRAMRKGEKALSQANYSEAIASCQKAIQLNGRSADAHICLANAFMGSTPPGMPDIEVLQQARKEEQTALELAPNNAEALAGAIIYLANTLNPAIMKVWWTDPRRC